MKLYYSIMLFCQRDSEELKRELEELREVMIKTHEENVGHRLTIAEKEDAIRVSLGASCKPQ